MFLILRDAFNEGYFSAMYTAILTFKELFFIHTGAYLLFCGTDKVLSWELHYNFFEPYKILSGALKVELASY